MGATRDAQRGRHADVRDVRLERAGVVEDLNPLVVLIGDEHVALRVDRDRVRDVELARLQSSRPPRRDEPAVLVELRDSRVAVPIGDEDVSGYVPRHIARPVEVVAWHAGARRSTAAATTTAAAAAGSARV